MARSAVADRPIVFADTCAMPFKDKTFDFVLAFHVLEHMRDPAAFLRELCRVGRAGYIETPSVLFERLDPYDVHLLEILALDGKLYIRKKPAAATNRFLQTLSVTTRLPAWKRLFYGTPELFHVRYFWRDSIPFEVVNPEETCAWFQDAPADAPHASEEPAPTGWRSAGQSVLRKLYSRTRLAACPARNARMSCLQRPPDWGWHAMARLRSLSTALPPVPLAGLHTAGSLVTLLRSPQCASRSAFPSTTDPPIC